MVLELEGGLVYDPQDPGGLTKYGISQRAYPDVDIANLRVADAREIYRRDYWEPVAERVSDPRLQILAFDSAVNHGVRRATEWLKAYPDFNDYLAARIRFYTNLETWPRFGRGWARRVATVVETANRHAHEVTRVDALVDNRSLVSRLSAALRGISGPVKFRIRSMTSKHGLKMDIDSV